jgi:ArsR family transcriptional regulator
MPAEIAPNPARTSVRVVPSAVIELNFGLFAVARGKDHDGQDWMRALEADQPGLVERVRMFWGTPSYYEWPEMMVLAWSTGSLFDADCGPFVGRLHAALAKPINVPPLPTEEDGTEQIVARRLAELRESPERRSMYIALLDDLWAAMRPEWETSGYGRALEAVRATEARLRDGADLAAVVPGAHISRRERYASLLRSAYDAGELTITPMALTQQGQYIFGVPGMLLVGAGPESARKAEDRRERAERAAARFKVLADPTRLALLGRIINDPISVTDLAVYFELSQPTVSVHVKMLREAGLLESERKGAQTLYRAREEAVRQFVEAAVADALDGAGRC